MLAYKSAIHYIRTPVVITLEIPDDAITTMNRSGIVNRQTAKYRTNKAKVLKIEDDAGTEYANATSAFYETKKLTYIPGETIVCDDFDMDLEKVCSTGIHFFLDFTVAKHYKRTAIQNGILTAWYDSDQTMAVELYENGTLIQQECYPPL